MKQIIFLLITASILFCGCKKSSHEGNANSIELIAEARNYFEDSVKNVSSPNPQFDSKRVIDWMNAKVIDFQHVKAVIAPVKYPKPFYMGSTVDPKRLYNINEITWACIYKDSVHNCRIEQVVFFPDSTFKQNEKFKGLIEVDAWNGNALKKFKVENNNIILQPTENYLSTAPKENGTTENMISITATCYESYGYNYSVDDPDNGTYWSVPAGCSYSISSDDNNGFSYSGVANSSGGGGSSISPANSFSVLSGNNVIANIIDYNKCFTNIAGYGNTFSVTVCVEQPKPGTRDTWIVSGNGAAGSTFGTNPIDVGHTFLIFKQTTGAGSIVRNVGFYPAANVNPALPSNQGQLNDDEGHSYDISLTVMVTNSQFFNMLNYAAQGNDAGFMYNLNGNNCTTFALNTLVAGSIFLPRTIGSWPNGTGNDPGDLGEDIRSLNLSSNMTRNLLDVSHPNTGNCN